MQRSPFSSCWRATSEPIDTFKWLIAHLAQQTVLLWIGSPWPIRKPGMSATDIVIFYARVRAIDPNWSCSAFSRALKTMQNAHMMKRSDLLRYRTHVQRTRLQYNPFVHAFIHTYIYLKTSIYKWGVIFREWGRSFIYRSTAVKPLSSVTQKSARLLASDRLRTLAVSDFAGRRQTRQFLEADGREWLLERQAEQVITSLGVATLKCILCVMKSRQMNNAMGSKKQCMSPGKRALFP